MAPAATMDETQAAATIQAAYRGHHTRKVLKEERADEEDAAVAIQSAYRGHQTRRELKQRAEEEQAAVAIQSAYRGHQTRRELSQAPPAGLAADEEEEAAVAIQSAYRGHKARKELREHQAAAPSDDLMSDDAAAATIQAAYRGHKTRKELATTGPPTKKVSVRQHEQRLQRAPDAKLAYRRVTPHGGAVAASPSPHPTSASSARSPNAEVSKRLATHGAQIYHVTFYRNGDTKFPGRAVQVNTRETRSFDLFLDKLTKLLDPKFGTVHKVFGVAGEPVAGFADFEEGGSYVACGNGAFKKRKYTTIKTFKQKEQAYQAPDLSHIKMQISTESRILKSADQPLQIYVLPNGDEDGAGAKILFTKKDMPSWEKVLERITAKFQTRLHHGAVTRLVELDGGKDITTLEGLQSGGVYVAVDRGALKMPPFGVGPDGTLIRKAREKVPLKIPPVIHAKPRVAPKFVSRFDELHEARKRAVEEKERQQRVTKIGKITTRTQAVEAVDAIYNQLVDSEMESEELAHTLEDMARSLRTISYNHKQESPDATDVFDERIEEVLSYMMQTDESSTKSPEEIRDKFEPMVQAALSGKLPHWETQAAAYTALVILLDQFPRSLYRGTPRMYTGDRLCRDVVVRAVFDSNVMDEVHPVYRLFPCLALTHQEDLEMQKLCVSEWARATAYFEENDPIRDYGATFKSNYEIIQTFGRFPDRNKLLGRESTEKEVEYLAPAAKDKKDKKKKEKRSRRKTRD